MSLQGMAAKEAMANRVIRTLEQEIALNETEARRHEVEMARCYGNVSALNWAIRQIREEAEDE